MRLERRQSTRVLFFDDCGPVAVTTNLSHRLEVIRHDIYSSLVDGL